MFENPFGGLDANDPEQLLTQSPYRATVLNERKLRGELLLDRTVVVVREPGGDARLLSLKLTDLAPEFFSLNTVHQRRFSAHACPPWMGSGH
jgi:hypothetical protein